LASHRRGRQTRQEPVQPQVYKALGQSGTIGVRKRSF